MEAIPSREYIVCDRPPWHVWACIFRKQATDGFGRIKPLWQTLAAWSDVLNFKPLIGWHWLWSSIDINILYCYTVKILLMCFWPQGKEHGLLYDDSREDERSVVDLCTRAKFVPLRLLSFMIFPKPFHVTLGSSRTNSLQFMIFRSVAKFNYLWPVCFVAFDILELGVCSCEIRNLNIFWLFRSYWFELKTSPGLHAFLTCSLLAVYFLLWVSHCISCLYSQRFSWQPLAASVATYWATCWHGKWVSLRHWKLRVPGQLQVSLLFVIQTEELCPWHSCASDALAIRIHVRTW